MEKKDKITCEITKELAVLSESGNGYTKEVNFVSWRGSKEIIRLNNKPQGA